MGCVQDMAGKKKLLVKFEDKQRNQTSSSSLQFLCSKEEVETDDIKSNLPEKEKCEFLIIDGDPEFE